MADQTKMLTVGEEMQKHHSIHHQCTISPNIVEARWRCLDLLVGFRSWLARQRSPAGTPWPGSHCLWCQLSHLRKADGGRILHGLDKLVCTTVSLLCSGLLRPWGMVLDQTMGPLRALSVFKGRQGRSVVNRHTRRAICRRQSLVNHDGETKIFNQERRD